MAEYASEKGIKVQTVAGDPPAPFEGQVWYNSSTGSHRVNKGALVSAWSTGGNMNTHRTTMGSAGTSVTSGLAFGGDLGPSVGSPEQFDGTESYNGTSWTEVNNLNTARWHLAGTGSETAALAAGGNLAPGSTPSYQIVTETWNGTNWTEVNDMNTARRILAGSGSNTSALIFGGINQVPVITGQTESWNGTNWTEVNDLNTARFALAGAGADNTSALAFGGASPSITGVTESWNGTNWTEVNDLNTARDRLASTKGDATSALAIAGFTPPATNITESWNGTNWTEIADMSETKFEHGGSGSSSSALAFGGEDPANSVTTEEFIESGGSFNITSS